MSSLHHANTLMQNQQWQEAHAAFQQLLIEQPHLPQAHLGLGKVYLHIEAFDKAIEHLTSCCHAMPHDYQALILLAKAFESVNSHQDVATVYDYMLTTFPNSPLVRYHSAVYFSEIGMLANACEHIEHCLSLLLDSDETLIELTAHAWLLMIKLSKTVRTKKTLNTLSTLSEQAHKHNNITAQLIYEYAKGDIFDALSDYSSAFASWEQANKWQYQQCDVAIGEVCTFLKRLADFSLSAAVKQRIDSAKVVQENTTGELCPIFIVGLARTGSTLLEQLLCSHSEVDTIGETPIVSDQIATFFSRKYGCPYPDFLPLLSPADCENGAKIYHHALLKRRVTSPWVIDKLPANFQSIGLIKAIFPQAKIIHLQRNFADVALSTFKHYFASNEPYFCDLESLQAYHQGYLATMKHWAKHFDIIDIQYESLVTDQHKTMKLLKRACNIHSEYAHVDTASHGIQQPSKPIKTLSALQVREPLNRNGLSRSKPYKTYLNAAGIKIQ